MNVSNFTRFRYKDFTGYLLSLEEASHRFVAVRHSSFVTPWTDTDIHLHEMSEEFFLLLNGELIFLINDTLVNLRPNEILMVRPGVPHAIVQGFGQIEHFGFRAPALEDRCSISSLPTDLPQLNDEAPRVIEADYGFRIPFNNPSYKNCWSIGYGSAPFSSAHLLLAYLYFPSHEEANAGLGTRHRLHHHNESWEYYVVVEGSKTLKIEDQEVSIFPGEMLEVPPGVKHTLLGRTAPYVGFTFRVPIRDDKVEI